jgi:prepilin-type N-terminal cleavage/methylation domain-containing protein
MLASSARKAFTLMEMLLVLGVIALLAVIALPISLRVVKSQNVTQAVTQLQGALSQAKSRAMLDKHSHGIRFLWKDISDPYEGLWYDSTQFDKVEKVEDIGSFAEGWVFTPDPKQPDILQVVQAHHIHDWWSRIHPGDLLELNGGGQLYPLHGWLNPNYPSLNPQLLRLARPLAPTDIISPQSFPPGARPSNYRIYRRPRRIPGEKTEHLPANVVIDVQKSLGLPWFSWYQYAIHPILFSPSGRVIGPAAVHDMICLWVQDTSEGNEQNRALVVIYTRTGMIASYPVDESDPYSFARTGRGMGAGGL